MASGRYAGYDFHSLRIAIREICTIGSKPRKWQQIADVPATVLDGIRSPTSQARRGLHGLYLFRR